MNLKKKLVLLSLQMILSGFITEFFNKLLFCLAFSGKKFPYCTVILLEGILTKARLAFVNAEKAYNILLNHHTRTLSAA